MAAESDLKTADLAERFRRGNENAARDVLRIFGPVLRAWLRKNFGDLLVRDEIDQVILDAMIRAWQGSAECRDNFAGWLSTIAYNAGADFLRSLSIDGQRPVHFADPDRWLHLVDDCNGRDDGESSDGSELVELVAQALAELPARQREVIISDYWRAGVSDRELAKKFGVTESTIRNDRMRAKRKLPEILIGLGVEKLRKVRRNSVYLDRETNSSPSAPPDSSDFGTGNGEN